MASCSIKADADRAAGNIKSSCVSRYQGCSIFLLASGTEPGRLLSGFLFTTTTTTLFLRPFTIAPHVRDRTALTVLEPGAGSR